MARITFKNKDICIEVEQGTTLSDCIRRANLHLETPCNCIGICGKCKVKAIGELYQPSDVEEKFLLNIHGTVRIACLAKVSGDTEIELSEVGNGLRTSNKGYAVDMAVDSCIKEISLPTIKQKDSTPYNESIPYKFSSANLYEKIGRLENEDKKENFGITYGQNLLDISMESQELLGLAVDIGTTGVSAYLIKLKTGEVINQASALNPQTQFGGDVLSRISYCINHEHGIVTLKTSIIKGLNDLIEKLLNDKWKEDKIYHMVIAANTTMLHLLLGVHPLSIAKAPYRPVFLQKVDVGSSELDIHINKHGIITLMPSASAYVGADILAGIAAVAFDMKRYPAIFVDIGTNGEIAIVVDGKMVATSTAAGPALEGMNISCGCRAEEGAIDSFSIDDDFHVNYSTIGGIAPKGICGSGLIDIAASLVEKKVVLKNGRFNPNLPETMQARFKDKKFYITENIYISQKDIRQIQLAKGAIAAGITVLLDEIGIEMKAIEEIMIAGEFGYHMNPCSILKIGLIPSSYDGKITFVGNSSLEGARLALTNTSILKKIVDLKEKIKIVELSMRDDFQQYFINELNF